MTNSLFKYMVLFVLLCSFSCNRPKKDENLSEEWLCIRYKASIWREMHSKHREYSEKTGFVSHKDQHILNTVYVSVPAKDYVDLVSICKREEPIPRILKIDSTCEMKFTILVGKYEKDFSVSMGALQSFGNDTPDENNETIKCARRCFEVFSQLTGKSGESEFFPQAEEGWH